MMPLHPPLSPETEDVACFALWDRARAKESEILDDLAAHFEVLGTFHVHWTEKHYNRNISRLYESNAGTEPFFKYNRKIGKPPFTFVIARDKNPAYTCIKSVSGAIEPANRNVIARKYAYRALFQDSYQIHSSGNAYEFFFQMALVLGIDMLEATLAGKNKGRVIELHKDLEGADGWRDWHELFSILNYSAHYLTLNNPDDLACDGAIEFLCDDYQRLASAANVYQQFPKPYTGKIKVAGQNIAANIRFVGDNCYPSAWAKDILNGRESHQGCHLPSAQDQFFSLLYRAKVHQRHVADKHAGTLAALAKELQYDWFDSAKIHDDAAMAENLSGYMRANKYFYAAPLDKELGKNTAVIKKLPKLAAIGAGETKRKWKKLKRDIRNLFRKRQSFQ